MINKVENWDKVPANYGDYKRVTAGGYVCKVLACRIENSKTTGKKMLVVNFDIAEGDFKDFYLERYKAIPRDQNNPQEPKWQAKYYILLEGEGYEGRLKAFITSVEESNENYVWDWNEEHLQGKLFGGIFREEEYIYNGEVRTNAKLWQVRSVKKIREGEFDIPRKKELSEEERNKLNAPFDNFTPATEDDLPF